MQIGKQQNPFSARTFEGGGKIAVGTDPVAVSFAREVCSIIISADADNTQPIYIGNSSVNSSGGYAMTYLLAGDTVSLDYNPETEPLFVVAAGAGQYFWKGGLL